MKQSSRILLFAACLVVALFIGRYVVPANNSRPATEAGSRTDSQPSVAQTTEASIGTPQDDPHLRGATMQKETGVFINRRELSRGQVMAIAATYHYIPPAGHYWYDSMSGAWGLDGRETAGFLSPGHDFGPLPQDASNGNTGVFVNGRELNLAEAMNIQRNFGAVYRGRWWLDGRTGYYGVEGNPIPVGNLATLVRSRQNTRGGDNFWCSVTACGNDDGHTGYVDVGGTIVTYDH